MFKKLLSVLISYILLFIFGTSFIVYAAYSPEEKSISENKAKFQQMSDKILEVNAQISGLNSQLSKLNSVIKKNNNDISESEKKINGVEARMELLKKDITAGQKLADDRVRAMYKNGGDISYLSLILSSKDFSDFFVKIEAVKKIAAYDKKILEDLNLNKKALEGDLSDLNRENERLLQLKATNLASIQQLNSKKKDLNNLIIQFNKEREKAAALIEENEKKLIGHAVSVIDSKNPTINEMKGALETLKGLLPQLSTPSVKKVAQTYIEDGDRKLAVLIANSTSDGSADASDTYKATYTMAATAYTGDTFTALGLKPVRDPNGLSTIAVDPDVIPLGTKVYIPGYGYAICADTGGAIKGDIIDLFFNSEDECNAWGRRTVTLNIIAYPGEW